MSKIKLLPNANNYISTQSTSETESSSGLDVIAVLQQIRSVRKQLATMFDAMTESFLNITEDIEVVEARLRDERFYAGYCFDFSNVIVSFESEEERDSWVAKSRDRVALSEDEAYDLVGDRIYNDTQYIDDEDFDGVMCILYS